jgi:hypothetical protein
MSNWKKISRATEKRKKKKHTNIGSRDMPEVVLGIIIVIIVNGNGGDVATLVAIVIVVDRGNGDGNMNYRRCTSLF